MNDILIRPATIKDIDFIVETIIQAEKSGTDVLSYQTIFGLSEEHTRELIKTMLMEDVDGCELSLSSYLVAELGSIVMGSVGAWIEAFTGLSSSQIKGNLLNYFLPKENLYKSIAINKKLSKLHLDNLPNTLQIGVVYVNPEGRGKGIVNSIIEEHVKITNRKNVAINEMCVQVFANNTPAIKSYKKIGFITVKQITIPDDEIAYYLPANSKILMKKQLVLD